MRSEDAYEMMQVILAALRVHLPSGVGLTHADIAALRRLRLGARHLRRGDDLFIQGRRSDGIFLFMEGYALRYRILSDGRRQVLDVCVPGDTVGGPSCFLGAALTTATALTDAAVAFVSSSETISAFEHFPRLTLALFRSTATEAARIGEHLIDVGRRGVRERVAHFVLELSSRLEAIGLGTRDAFTLPITQVQLADVLGLSIPHTNRVLRRLREEQLLEVSGSHFRIRNREALADLADFNESYLGLGPHAPVTTSQSHFPTPAEMGAESLRRPDVRNLDRERPHIRIEAGARG